MARLIPTSMPLLREHDYFSRRLARAELVRNLIHAQNYIWAKAYRVYMGHAYEGHGNWTRYDIQPTEPGSEAAPTGHAGKCIASFLCPPNWGASSRLRLCFRSVQTGYSTGFMGRVVFGVYTLAGVYTGSYKEWTDDRDGTIDAEVTMAVPQDQPYQIRMFLCPTLGQDESSNKDIIEIKYLSAAYDTANASEVGGDTPQTIWQPITPTWLDHANNQFVVSALLRTLIRNTLHIWAYRPPTICNTWLAKPWHNTSTYTEVARYRVFIPSHITQLAGHLNTSCFSAGAGSGLRIKVGGVVVWTSAALAASEQEINVPAFNVTSNAYNDITVEAQSPAAGAGWGTVLTGVHLYEETVSLGITPFATYQPINEDLVEADDEITVAVLKKVVQNDAWLAKNRIRWVIGDWLHRTYKRVDDVNANGGKGTVSTEPYFGWDWTRGHDTAHRLEHPKNITVRGDNFSADAWSGSTAHDGQDGFGSSPNGYASDTGATGGLSTWPGPNQFYRHGRRLAKIKISNATGAPLPINNVTNSRMRWYVRGRRLPPNAIFVGLSQGPNSGLAFDNGTTGPGPEDFAFKDKAFIANYLAGIQGMRHNFIGGNDMLPRWGEQNSLGINVGSEVVGRCPYSYSTWHQREGDLFEVELQAQFIADEPLTQTQLEAL